MEKWKIIVIVLLLAALSGYGYYQANPPQRQAETDPTAQPTPRPSNERLMKLQGQEPPAWDIPQSLWANTSQPISLADLKGSVALVEFWRIGCSHCEQAAPFLNSLYEKNKGRGLKMVTIHSPGNVADPNNPENDWNLVKQKIKEWGITYPVAYDEKGNLFKETYGGDTFPTLMILDREGKVQSVMSGHTPEKAKALEATLDKALSELEKSSRQEAGWMFRG